MSEVVVYEDTPFADYLQSIDSIERPIKVESSFSSRPKTRKLFTVDWSRLWKHSLFHDVFSISLPRIEENAFEEKFKYIVVTSPLLSQKLSIHHPTYQKEELPPLKKKDSAKPLAAMSSGLVVLLGVEKLYLQPLRLPVLTLFFSASASLFFFYRHKRRSAIRQLYQLILTKLQSLIERCEAFDQKVHRVLITIQEIELVSRGYRLSTPLSPISRIEQNPQNKERRKCIYLRSKLASTLRRMFILFEEGIIDLVDVRDRKNLGTLYEMYSVDTIATLSAVMEDEEGGYSLDQLKRLNHIMHSKRRECMVNFLALEEQESRVAWKTVNQVLDKLEEEVAGCMKEIVGAMDAEFYTPLNQDIKTNTKLSDARLQKFVHRLASLEQQTRTMEAKLYLCNEGVRELNSDPSSESHERLLNEYLSVQKAFEDMLVEWELGKSILENYLKPSVLPNSPIESPKMTSQDEQESNIEETEGKGLLLDSEDVSDILNLPMPAKASVFEAISGVVERNAKEKSKMSRMERIEEMKRKRVKETEEKAKRVDSQTMVHELKSVLNRRITQLDLDDKQTESK
ncbi:hypothetical protein K501DRAFT_333274 [Backusella circina FSU 941]|nr:hypothetical protein K501DRAFT_333274 [Backusella circina FSU 941]